MSNDILKSVSQGGYGAYDAENRRIKEISDELQRLCRLHETQPRTGQEDRGRFEIEQRVAEYAHGDRNLVLKTTKYNEVEKLVHKTIDRLTDLRIRQNREFFNVAPQMALDIFRDIASAIDDAEVTLYEDNEPIVESEHKEPQKREVKRPRFKFSMCGIKIGERVTFDPTGLIVKVASDDSIEYEGRIYKLSPFVGTFMPEEHRNTSGAYQGAKYFSYNGKVLDDIRRKKK